MNELRIFSNPEFGEVRTVTIDGEVWFVGNDVARALGYEKYRDAVPRHVDADDKQGIQIEDAGQRRTVTAINESGLYSLIFGSQLESAKRFKRWVTSEVLPSIRRTGSYSIERKPDSYTIEDPAVRARRWAEEYEEKKILQNRVSELEPKAMICDEMINSNMLTNFLDAAYIIGISQSQFTGWLEESGYIYRNADNEIRPAEKYRNSELFAVRPFKSRRSNFTGSQTFITAKGLAAFKIILKNSGQTQDTLPKHGGRKRK